jgi:hypothetical protein
MGRYDRVFKTTKKIWLYAPPARPRDIPDFVPDFEFKTTRITCPKKKKEGNSLGWPQLVGMMDRPQRVARNEGSLFRVR